MLFNKTIQDLGATGLIFNKLADDKFVNLRSDCAPDCSNDEVNDLENLVKARNATYGAGIVAAVVTGALLAWKSMDGASSQVDLKGRQPSIKVDF